MFQQLPFFTEHQLFGEQSICLKFKPETEIGIGFYCKDQIIYIDKGDVMNYNITNNTIIINGKSMRMKIVIKD